MSIAIRGGVMMHMLGDDQFDAHVRVEQRRHSSSSIERTSSEVTTLPTLTRGDTVLGSMEVESSEDHRFGESELAIPAALAVFTQENVPLPAGLRRQVDELADPPGGWHKFARSIRDDLAQIPIETSA